jgi:hypothetical protein
MSGIGGTSCRKLKAALRAGGVEVRDINDHEFWADGYRYVFDASGENQIDFVRDTSRSKSR